MAKVRFQDDNLTEVISHNLDDTLPEIGKFEAIVSSFAIHHVTHDRNLREIGFADVDCYWKWLELALLIGFKPN